MAECEPSERGVIRAPYYSWCSRDGAFGSMTKVQGRLTSLVDLRQSTTNALRQALHAGPRETAAWVALQIR